MDMSSTIIKFEHDPIVRHNSEHLHLNFNATNETVTSLYASGHPNITCPKDATKILFEKPAHHLRSKVKREFLEHEVTQDEMDMAAKYGRFPQRPSNLFLKVCVHRLCNKMSYMIFSYFMVYLVVSSITHCLAACLHN